MSERNSRRIFLEGAKRSLRDIVSLLRSSIPGGVVGALYGLYRHMTNGEADMIMSLLLYNTITVTLQPIIIYYKTIEFMGHVFSLQSSKERPGFIKTRCLNLEVCNYRDVDDVRYIEVRCKLGYMTHYGCPMDCPGYEGPEPTGAGTFVGVVLGGLIGLAGGPLGVLAGAILGGLAGTAIEAGGTLTLFEQLVNEAYSRGLRVIVRPLT